MSEALSLLGLVLLAAAACAYGSLVGTGGGFLLAPLLLLLYPERQPEVVTAISLAVVLANAGSSSIVYGRQKRVDRKAGLTFAAATLPGAVAGALLVSVTPRHTFEVVFGAVLLLLAVWLQLPRPGSVITTRAPARFVTRLLTDSRGDTYRYAYDPYVGAGVGLVVGLVSSLFGVGGGVVFVPAMILLMRFPAVIATATSSFILVFTAALGVAVRLWLGSYEGVEVESLVLMIGGVIGGRAGAHVSGLMAAGQQQLIVRLLGVAMLMVSLRLLAGGLL